MNNSKEFSAPHIRSGNSEFLVAFDLLIAAAPAMVWSVIVYGLRPLAVIAISVICAILFEVIYSLILRRAGRIPTAAALGAVVALFMPAGINYLFAALAAFIAVTLRRFTGGIINPIAASLLPLFFLGDQMALNAPIFTKLPIGELAYTGERSDSLMDSLISGTNHSASVLDIFLGKIPESIGAMSALLLLIGGIYLLIRRVIAWQIPVGYFSGAIVVWLIFFFDGAHYEYMIFHLCAGGIFLSAFFAATEYSSAPVTPVGRFIHGAGCGALAILFRHFGIYRESVLLAMLIMSLFSRILDMITAERYFGHNGKKAFARLSTLIPNFKKKN